MASRAELTRPRATPRLSGVLRPAITDFYFNSVQLVLANTVWGFGLVAVILVALVWPLGALVVSPFLAFPTASAFRVAAQIVRGGRLVSFREALESTRTNARPTLLLGLAFVATVLVLGSNLVTGLSSSEPVGWVIATFAVWGLMVLWCGSIVAWPLIVDPLRAERPVSDRLRVAVTLALARPVRSAGLGALVAVIGLVSAILTVALLTIGVAFIALLACRAVYPVADSLDAVTAGDRP